MTAPIAGIDPHQAQFTVGIVDTHGVELAHDSFRNTARGFIAAIDLLVTHGVDQVGIEGSAGWGTHVAIALVAAGFDAREVPAQRSAMQRRSRRLAKTDAVDAVAAARALLAEPSLGPVQTLDVYDPLVAELEAVLEHRRALVEVRTLLLHHVGDQLSKLPTELRDQLPVAGKLESRLRKLETIRRGQRLDAGGGVPGVVADPNGRAGPSGSTTDPYAGASHQRTARRARHDAA